MLKYIVGFLEDVTALYVCSLHGLLCIIHFKSIQYVVWWLSQAFGLKHSSDPYLFRSCRCWQLTSRKRVTAPVLQCSRGSTDHIWGNWFLPSSSLRSRQLLSQSPKFCQKRGTPFSRALTYTLQCVHSVGSGCVESTHRATFAANPSLLYSETLQRFFSPVRASISYLSTSQITDQSLHWRNRGEVLKRGWIINALDPEDCMESWRSSWISHHT